MKKWTVPPGMQAARDELCQMVATTMAYYDLPELSAVKMVLSDPKNRLLIQRAMHPRKGRDVISPQTLANWFRASKLEPYSEGHVTDGLSEKQVELFNYLRLVMSPDMALEKTRYFLPA